jgi:hypothetical protein
LAKFLDSAADKADWITVEQKKKVLVFIASNGKNKYARLEVTTDYLFTATYTNEWGLLE